MKPAARLPLASVIACASVWLAGCNGFSGDTLEDGGSGSSGGTGTGSSTSSSGGGVITPPIETYTVGGTVSGLSITGTGLVLQNGTSGDTLAIVSNGRFVFPNGLAPGSFYKVVVQNQPGTPPEFCRVNSGSGVISDINITNVSVQCATTGKYLFAVNPYDNNGTGTVAAFAIDPTTGALTAAAGSPYVPAEANPVGVAVDPGGQYIYVANQGSANVSSDAVGADGALTLDVSVASTGTATNHPDSIALDLTGPYLYVGGDDTPNGTVEAYSIGAGVLTPAAGTLAASTYTVGNVPLSLAVDPTAGILFGANLYDADLFDYSINAGQLLAVNGSPFLFQQGGATNTPFAVAVSPANKALYVTDSTANSVSLYRYNTAANGFGTLTLIAVYSAGASVGTTPVALAIDATQSFLFVANQGSGNVSVFRISGGSGVLTPVGGSPFEASGVASVGTPTSVSVDPSSQFVYVSNGDAGTISVFLLNFSSGALTPVGNPVPSILATGGTGGPSSMAIE